MNTRLVCEVTALAFIAASVRQDFVSALMALTAVALFKIGAASRD